MECGFITFVIFTEILVFSGMGNYSDSGILPSNLMSLNLSALISVCVFSFLTVMVTLFPLIRHSRSLVSGD